MITDAAPPTTPCPHCKAIIELYESISFDGDEALWWGTCGDCACEVEGPEAKQMKVVQGPRWNLDAWMEAGGEGA
jgi:hypothetical protein